jgi:hypothetical protein
VLLFFLLILAVSQRRFFSVAFLVIYSVSYNMSFVEVPDVSCIWSVVTIWFVFAFTIYFLSELDFGKS